MSKFITKDCLIKLKIDYKKNLKEKKNLIKEIKLTREYGDLSENSEYKSVKDKQNIINIKLQEISSVLKNCKIINNIENDNKISFLNEVKLVNIESGKTEKYKIVNNEIADIKLGYISIDSNLAKSMIGKSINDIIILKKIKSCLKLKVVEII